MNSKGGQPLARKRTKQVTIDFNSVRIEKVDEYLEMFYDDTVEVKTMGAMSLLTLCFSHENME